jgi:hypothetical protein
MDVATLALIPRRVVVVDDGFMDRVVAVLERPGDWSPAGAPASMWPEFHLHLVQPADLAEQLAELGSAADPVQLLVTSSRNEASLQAHLALAATHDLSLLVVAATGWRPPRDTWHLYQNRALLLYEPWESLELLQAAGTLTTGYQAQAMERHSSYELQQLAAEQEQDLTQLQQSLCRNLRQVSQRVAASEEFVALMSQHFKPMLEHLMAQPVRAVPEEPLVPMLAEAGASLRRTLSGVCWQHWLATAGPLPEAERAVPMLRCIAPWVVTVCESLAGGVRPLVVTLRGDLSRPRVTEWDLSWWCGDLLIADMLLAYSDRSQVALQVHLTKGVLRLQVETSHAASRMLPEQAQLDPWPTVQQCCERVPQAAVEHVQDQTKAYSGTLHWPVSGGADAVVPCLRRGLFVAASMHEMAGLFERLALDIDHVSVWLGDRLPVDAEHYPWVVTAAPMPGLAGFGPEAEAVRLMDLPADQQLDYAWASELGLFEG